ncbi:hypothetical protein OsJ_06728 [Oryza sativa Japonica Group]|uniref:Uncharacterized protein n=1 Tax=Oryza sativa subsp. japonica TaxID=39947 RepID=B9EZZ7_ORYSJ|nr:hypothetical protein OsJ_06728 [Oryza sativa Japonica Group]
MAINLSISVPTGPAFRNAPHIGREMEKSHLIQLVSQDGENHHIISIWGMIGVGKTSFIRSVYESEEITSMFEQCAWVTVSHPFNLHNFITSLAHELDSNDFSVLGNGLQKSEESIKASKRRCLLVLDDVSSIEEWSLIKPHLPSETNTKIIVTTREASIAEHCSMTCKNIYKLEGLKEDAALALFKNKAFLLVFVDGSNIDLDLDMTTQAKLIIKECDGHPLAITNIVGFLARKQKTATEWKKLNDDFSSGYLSLRGCADIYHLPNSLGNLWDIQVLDVSGTSIIKLPKTITKLKKLHYLRAGNIPKDDDTSSIELKESCDLSKMEHEPIDDLEIPDVEAKSTLVLDVSGTSIIKLPKIITKLKKLHYLRAGNIPKDDATSSIELKESSDLSKMEHEPIDDLEIPDVEAKSVQFGMEVLDRTTSYCTITMQNTDYVKKRDIFHKYCKVLLPSILQELDMYGVKAPKGIGQLNDLHTLGVVNVVTGKVILRELEKLKKLHKLGLMGINKKNSQVVLSVIANLALLHSLSLQAEGEPGLQGCLDHTFAPLSKLQSLKIYGNLVTLPTWITQIQNLTKLKLRSTQLKLDLFLEVLGKLPHLAILRLWMNSFQSKELCFNFQQGTFLSLVVMELKDQGGLKSLTFMQGAMPRLELLQIDNCIHIDENGLSGVSSLPSLREVMLKGDHNEELMKNLCDQITLNQNQPVLKGA